MGAFDSGLPSHETYAYRLLGLVAVSGEFPTGQVSRLPGSTTYKEAVIRSLKKERLLKPYSRDRLRGYRLGSKAKRLLMQENTARFAFYLTGETDTNRLKCELSRRLRLHRLAQTYVTMQNAGVSIFRDEKPSLWTSTGSGLPLDPPAFYSSREVKEMGMDAIKIRGSRLTGVLPARSGLLAVYNMGSSIPNFDYRTELRTKAFLRIALCQQRLSKLYAPGEVYGLLFSDSMGPLSGLLTASSDKAPGFFLLDGSYEHFYYLTNDHRGESLLRFLADPSLSAQLNRVLLQDLFPANPDSAVENDGFAPDGRPVLFSYLPDIPRLNRFAAALELHDQTGVLICCDFQREALANAFPERIVFQTISFEKLERSFLLTAKQN